MKFFKAGLVLLFVVGLCFFVADAMKTGQVTAWGDQPTVESLMKRGCLFLKDSEWKQASEYFDRVLDIDPEYAPAYIGMLCAELKIKQEGELADHQFAENKDYQKALRFADANYRAKLEGYVKASEEKLRLEKGKIFGRIREYYERGALNEIVVPMAGYDWRVLDVHNNRALLLCVNIIEKRPYNKESKEVTWETCSLRGYLNGEFYNNLPGDFKAMIAETKLTNDNNRWYGTSGGDATTDKIFLLSIEEVVKYFGDSGQLENLPNPNPQRRAIPASAPTPRTAGPLTSYINDQYNSARIAQSANGTASWWWLRSPGDGSHSAALVTGYGRVNLYGFLAYGDVGGVRPALWLNLIIKRGERNEIF